MSKNASSRRVNLAKDQHATATETETERQGVQSHIEKNNRSINDVQFMHRPAYSKVEAERRRCEARHRIERTRQQRQAARYFRELLGVVRRV